MIYPHDHGIEYILTGTSDGRLIVLKRGFQDSSSLSKLAFVREAQEGSGRKTRVNTRVNEDLSAEPTQKFPTQVECRKRSSPFSELKRTLSLLYAQEKIRNGRLNVGLSLSIIQSLVLGNLSPSSKDPEADLPFILAHLKQHLAQDLNLLSVDFRRISDDRVWVLACPREKIQEILSLNHKSAFVRAVEPSINGLFRLLSERFYSLAPQFYADETFAFLWIDAHENQKIYRFSCLQGVQILASERLSPTAGELSEGLASFLIACLEKYHTHWAKFSIKPIDTPSAENPHSKRSGYPLFLWIEQCLQSILLSALDEAFGKNSGLEVRIITPPDCGLEHADEYVSLGLALR
jgi:hypothetical protein